MTTLCTHKVRCALCGQDAEYMGIGSTNAFGTPDLDMRPPEMQRSTSFAWVQRCPKCGYCASTISVEIPHARDTIARTEYAAQLNDPKYSELANSFLCKALVDEQAGDLASATWALIWAAWECDDEGHSDQARTCRVRATEMLVRAQASSQAVAQEDGASTAILVDLLRRAERMAEAEQIIEVQGNSVLEGNIRRILDYQMSLIQKGDTARHTIGEALGPGL